MLFKPSEFEKTHLHEEEKLSLCELHYFGDHMLNIYKSFI